MGFSPYSRAAKPSLSHKQDRIRCSRCEIVPISAPPRLLRKEGFDRFDRRNVSKPLGACFCSDLGGTLNHDSACCCHPAVSRRECRCRVGSRRESRTRGRHRTPSAEASNSFWAASAFFVWPPGIIIDVPQGDRPSGISRIPVLNLSYQFNHENQKLMIYEFIIGFFRTFDEPDASTGRRRVEKPGFCGVSRSRIGRPVG
jgi:hypothetical protein